MGARFQENDSAVTANGVGAGQRGSTAFGVVWREVTVALARVARPKVRVEHCNVRLLIRASRAQAGRAWSSKPSGEGTMPVNIPPEVVTQLLDVLQSLGVSQQVMGNIRSKSLSSLSIGQGGSCTYSAFCGIGRKMVEVHLENLREQMTRNEHDYLASVGLKLMKSRFRVWRPSTERPQIF